MTNLTSPVVRLEAAELIHAHAHDGTPLGLAATTLEIHPGTWTALIGPNGSGKSTLANLIAGTARPTTGRVTRFASPADARTRTAFAHQTITLDPLLTIAENLHLAAQLAGLARDRAHQAVNREAAAFALTDRLNTRVSKLSGGLARRAHAARAFVTGRPLIVLDEPDAGADRDARALLAARCAQAASESNAAVVTVTHDAELAESAGRVIALAAAHVVADRTPTELLAGLCEVIARTAASITEPLNARTITDAAGTLFIGPDANAVESAAADLARAGHAITLAKPTLADAARVLAGRAHAEALP